MTSIAATTTTTSNNTTQQNVNNNNNNNNNNYVNDNKGYVFLCHSDVTKFACDAWLAANGGILDCFVRPILPEGALNRFGKRERYKDTWIKKMTSWPCGPYKINNMKNIPQPYFIDINTITRSFVEDFKDTPITESDGVKKTVEQIGVWMELAVEQFGKSKPLFGRAKHLLALPLIGTGSGGLFEATGFVIRSLLKILNEKCEKLQVDVALILYEKDVYVAAQKERARLTPYKYKLFLHKYLFESIDELSEIAVNGDLALFIGAGASMGAGLPSWAKLLEELASEFSLDMVQFKKLGYLDQAKIIDRRLQGLERSVGQEISKRLKSHYFSLTHALLQSLPTKDVITTNYDVLYEKAYKNVAERKKLSLLPYNPQLKSDRFLLKMHGCINHPEDIVLTRKDYIRYARKRAVLGGVLQSTLLTKHLLYIGFSLNDPNFDAIFDAVRNQDNNNQKSVVDVDGNNHDNNNNSNKNVATEKQNGKKKGLRKTYSSGNFNENRFKLSERNTAILLKSSKLSQELWEDDVKILQIANNDGSEDQISFPTLSRRQEIFLDALTSQCVLKTGVPYILEPKYKNLLSKPDIELKNIVDNFIEEMEKNDAVRKSSAFNTVDKMVRQLGGEIFFSNRSSYEVNNEESDDRKNRIEIENDALETYLDAMKEEANGNITKAVSLYQQAFKIWPGIDEAINATYRDKHKNLWKSLLDDTAGRLELKQKSIVRLIKNNKFINKLNKASAVEKESLKPSDAITKSKGVYDMFNKFDKDKDGVLNVREMNTLQAALGNNERYTKATLLRLCMANGVDHHNGGMTVNGFMLMYRKLGSVATAKDLAKLKISG